MNVCTSKATGVNRAVVVHYEFFFLLGPLFFECVWACDTTKKARKSHALGDTRL